MKLTLIWQEVFCFLRVIATSLRIAWACRPEDIDVAIASTVFVYTDIPLLFLVNLLFAQRLVRSQHPKVGWSKPISIAFGLAMVVTVVTIICMIVAVVVDFYTLSTYSHNAVREVLKCSATTLAIIASLPMAIAGASGLARAQRRIRMTKTTDKFGEGSLRSKVTIVLGSAFLLSLGAWFRAGVVDSTPVPVLAHDPVRPARHPEYLSKGCFYFFNFTIEIIVCAVWFAVRIDKRFHVPDRAQGPLSYAGGFVFAGEPGNIKKRMSNNLSQSSIQSSSRPSSMHNRASWAPSLSSQARNSKLENRVSWGGVSLDSVTAGLGEDRVTVIPYPEEDAAAEVDMEGIGKEMGYDPKSGRWALRRKSGSSTRPVSGISEASWLAASEVRDSRALDGSKA